MGIFEPRKFDGLLPFNLDRKKNGKLSLFRDFGDFLLTHAVCKRQACYNDDESTPQPPVNPNSSIPALAANQKDHGPGVNRRRVAIFPQ
ncbi:MAG: hypothetical protein HC859_11965 [Bacteroidia bacterium]|nr:hypothetical protein [Bacteroidia bacterium]